MSEQIREQISAFLDGELPSQETELLLRRLTRDAELRESFGRYALIGECMRGGGRARLSKGFAGRVNSAINGDAAAENAQVSSRRPSAWWHPLAGAGVAAGVAAVAIVALQQRSIAPASRAGKPAAVQIMQSGPAADDRGAAGPRSAASEPRMAAAQGGAVVQSAILTRQPPVAGAAAEPRSYVVPPSLGEAPMATLPARMTSYVFAHSKYSSVLAPNGVLNDLLSNADPETAAEAPRDPRPVP